MGLVLAALFAIGLSFSQLAGLGLTAAKVNHAAQEAAFVAASTEEPLADKTACRAVNGGLQNLGAFRDAQICRRGGRQPGQPGPQPRHHQRFPGTAWPTGRTRLCG